MSFDKLLLALVFIPLGTALVAVMLPPARRRWAVLLGSLAWPCFLVPLSIAVAREQTLTLVFGGWSPPLGIGHKRVWTDLILPQNVTLSIALKLQSYKTCLGQFFYTFQN